MYHGTDNGNFTTFNQSKGGELGAGIYLTDNKKWSEWYSGLDLVGTKMEWMVESPKVYELYASIKNPFYTTNSEYRK